MKRAPIKRRRGGVRIGVVIDVEFREWVRSQGCAISLYGTTLDARRHRCFAESGYQACDPWPGSIILIHHVRASLPWSATSSRVVEVPGNRHQHIPVRSVSR